jgi:urease accessory protein
VSPDFLLLSWFSPAYPVGAFAYSHGLEWAQEAGDITDRASLEGWLADLIRHGAARNDLILLAESWRRARGPAAGLAALNELAMAMAASSERRLETATQGVAFLAATRAAHPCAELDALRAAVQGDIAYPVAVGVAGAGHGVPLARLGPAYLFGFIANLVSASVRLGVVGQTDGQRVLAALAGEVDAAAAATLDLSLDDLGACAFRADLASLAHETQYSRLFRS